MKINKIGIIGLGYVGLPLAVEFGRKYKTVGYDIDSDENSYAVLNRYMQRDFPRVYKKMAKLFCFECPKGNENGKPNIKFDVQIPGQMFYWHLDNFGGLLQEQRDDYNKFAACDYDQRLIMRVIVFLDDNTIRYV